MNTYPVKLNIRLDWSEMDLFGHINNVAYFKYVQASRVNYWEQLGLDQMHADMKIGPLLAATSCQFRKPLFYPDTISIQASIHFMKNSSFGIHHQILNGQGELCAAAEDVIVMYDFSKNEKIAIPEKVRNLIEQMEGKKF